MTTDIALPYEDRLAAMAKAAVASEQADAKWISTKGGQLSFGGNAFAGNKLDAVVLDAVAENHYYTSRYDPDVIASPVCFAFGRPDADGKLPEMVPHPDSSQPQAETCAKCPQNQFGTAENGKGKACKNVRRLGLVAADNIGGDVAYLKVPVMSVKNWAAYVKQIGVLRKRPSLGVVTTIGTKPDAKSQFVVQFEHKRDLEPEELAQAFEAFDVVKNEIAFPYKATEQAEAPAPKRRKF